MIVVSDSSPIINLAHIGKLDLIPRLFTTIVIPHAVYDEVVTTGRGLPGSDELRAAEWAERMEARNGELIAELRIELDRGEAEAISLALEMRADLLIIDDRLGRAAAERRGLSVVGVVGILVGAKHRNLIPEVKPLLDNLVAQAGFWLSEPVYQRALYLASEEV